MKVKIFAESHYKAGAADYILFTLGIPSNESWTIKGFEIVYEGDLPSELFILINGNETYKTTNFITGGFVPINQEHPPGTRIDIVLHKLQADLLLYNALLQVEVNNV